MEQATINAIIGGAAWFMVGFAAMISAYHVALALISFIPRRAYDRPASQDATRISILIPAHNERAVLAATLRSCERLDYPAERFAVYVVADNCTDETAEIARSHGAVCLERNNTQQRGKGYALEWSIPQLLADGCDAILILDADCTIDAAALRTLDAGFQRADRAIQLNNAVSNPDANPLSYMLALANYLENQSFYAPKSRVGLFVSLRGTGMALHREIFERFPWQSRGICEDLEYSLQLIRSGVAVRFAGEVGVVSASPTDDRQLAVQRGRWVSGTVETGASTAWRLVIEGIAKRRWIMLDAAWTMLVAQRWFVVMQFLATLALVATYAWLVGDALTPLAIATGCVAVANVAYVAQGTLRFGLSWSRLAMFVAMPIQVAKYIALAVRAALVSRSRAWNRTPRDRVGTHEANL